LSSARRAPVTETLRDQRTCELAEPSLIGESVQTRQDILPYLQLLWASRQLLWRAGLWAILASTLAAFLIPVRYQSVTRLMPPDNASVAGVGMLAALAGRADMSALGGLAGDLLGVKSSGALFVGILGSDSVRDAVIEKFQLRKVYHTPKIEDARKALSEHTDVSEDRKSGIISIAVTDHDPKRAAGMAQTYVSELDRLVAQVSTSSARRERIFLEGRLESVKADLDRAAKNFSDFASKNTAIDIPAQGKAMVEAAATLQGELIAAQAELSGLQQIYTDSNVRVRAAEARVDELKRKLNELGGQGNDGQLNSDNSLYPSIRKLPLLGVTYADLYRETKIQETVYELLTQQYELAKVQEAKEIPTVRVLDEARVPTKKSFPPRTVIVMLGTMLGITLAMVWTTGKSRWEAVDASDPRKLFVQDVWQTAHARLPRFSWNGTGAEPNDSRSWTFWRKAGGNGAGRGPERK
jgi:uncharacterized protein involved in exopolysaccharide biosynthesis